MGSPDTDSPPSEAPTPPQLILFKVLQFTRATITREWCDWIIVIVAGMAISHMTLAAVRTGSWIGAEKIISLQYRESVRWPGILPRDQSRLSIFKVENVQLYREVYILDTHSLFLLYSRSVLYNKTVQKLTWYRNTTKYNMSLASMGKRSCSKCDSLSHSLQPLLAIAITSTYHFQQS